MRPSPLAEVARGGLSSGSCRRQQTLLPLESKWLAKTKPLCNREELSVSTAVPAMPRAAGVHRKAEHSIPSDLSSER